MRNSPVPRCRRDALRAAVLVSVLAPASHAQDPRTPAADLALVAGHVHPVSGPAIEDGVVLVAGERIVAVGRRDEVQVPAGARVLSYPDAHVYPGLVDALSDAFADASVRDDRSSDAGTAIFAGLDRHDEPSRTLVTYGITTAHVSNRAETPWRGIGAILRLRADGYEIFGDRQDAAVHMRLAAPPGHPLNRQRVLAAAGRAFDAVEAYTERLAGHDKAVAEYREKFEAWLEYHRQGGTAADAAEAGGRRGRGGESRGGRRRGRPGTEGARGRGGRGARGRRGSGEPPAEASSGPPGNEDAGDAAAAAKAPPERPEYPEPPAVEPDKEALQKVLAGELPLRVDARAADEIQAALELARAREIPRMILEHAPEAGDRAEDLARLGIPVVLADILPGVEPDADPGRLPARLAEADVSLAIGSGSAQRARHLPLIAAYAVGRGLDPDTALRALTLTPAEILGVSRDVGSVEPGKLADLVVFSAPLFQSDARVLRVLSAGTTQYEAR